MHNPGAPAQISWPGRLCWTFLWHIHLKNSQSVPSVFVIHKMIREARARSRESVDNPPRAGESQRPEPTAGPGVPEPLPADVGTDPECGGRRLQGGPALLVEPMVMSEEHGV